jgi:hypothetical protein
MYFVGYRRDMLINDQREAQFLIIKFYFKIRFLFHMFRKKLVEKTKKNFEIKFDYRKLCISMVINTLQHDTRYTQHQIYICLHDYQN